MCVPGFQAAHRSPTRPLEFTAPLSIPTNCQFESASECAPPLVSASQPAASASNSRCRRLRGVRPRARPPSKQPSSASSARHCCRLRSADLAHQWHVLDSFGQVPVILKSGTYAARARRGFACYMLTTCCT